MASASGRAPARAALAGNPSDLYGGAVLAVAVPELFAEVVVSDDEAAGSGVSPPSALVSGVIERFAREHGVPAGVSATWSTSIPREVGLAGSSAIAIAAARALCRLFDIALTRPRLASLALAVETEVLGIVAGLQDRVAQSYGGLTFMDFASDYFTTHGYGRYESLDPGLLPPLFVAYRAEATVSSGAVHGPLHERHRAGDPVVVDAMTELARCARGARDGLVTGDVGRFARCVDSSFDVRDGLFELDPRHVAMVRRARSLGASANYAGSGGAVVGSCEDAAHLASVLEGLRADGCEAIAPAA